jgi:AcrR family transcriptional regulator
MSVPSTRPLPVRDTDVPRVDGRRERGHRNKTAVVSALLDLYADGEPNPSAARVADVAGVSERSVFRYFDDMEDLASAAVELQWDRVKPLYLDLDSTGDFETRLQSIVNHRLRLHESIAGVFKVATMTAIRRPAVALAVEQRRQYLRSQTTQQLASETDRCGDAPVRRIIIDHILSLENIDYLKNSAGLSQAKLREVLATAVKLALRP